MKVGDSIKIISMKGEPNYTGRVGVIEHIDDIGQLHGTWGGCAVIPGEDEFEEVTLCALCHKEIKGYPNNGEPLVEGKVCERCNNEKVIPYRLKLHKGY